MTSPCEELRDEIDGDVERGAAAVTCCSLEREREMAFAE